MEKSKVRETHVILALKPSGLFSLNRITIKDWRSQCERRQAVAEARNLKSFQPFGRLELNGEFVDSVRIPSSHLDPPGRSTSICYGV